MREKEGIRAWGDADGEVLPERELGGRAVFMRGRSGADTARIRCGGDSEGGETAMDTDLEEPGLTS